MTSPVFDRIAEIIAENSEVTRDSITPDAHVINDLGIDSLDFLDIVFAIDKAFGIKVPVEAWTQDDPFIAHGVFAYDIRGYEVAFTTPGVEGLAG